MRVLPVFFISSLIALSPSALSQEEGQAQTTEPAAPVSAVKYACKHSGKVRRVEINYENADIAIPCSVNYFKDTEAPGQTTVLWKAQNSEGYCEAKATEFVEKLQGWGWDCKKA